MGRVIYSAAGSLVVLDIRSSTVTELLMAKRKMTTSFFPGYYVLPGGVISVEDVDLAKKLGVLQDSRDGGYSEATYRIAFLREFFEEVGVLITTKGLISGGEVKPFQDKLTRDEMTFADLLDSLDLKITDLPITKLEYAGSRLRPPFVKKTYLARYYLYKIRPEEKVEPQVNPSEIEDAGWYQPRELLEGYYQLRIRLPPPTLQQLRYLANRSYREALSKLGAVDKAKYGIDFPVELVPDVEAIPLPSKTLPPHQTTNLAVVGGKECYLVDPAPSTRDSRQHLEDVLNRLSREDKQVKGIILTHHHEDHVMGARYLQKQYGIPLIAHRVTADQVDFPIDVVLEEETWMTICDHRGDPLELKIIFTPGHTKGSLTVLLPSRRVAVVGDLLAGVGTVIINPPEGNLREYLRSLRRLQEFELDIVIPGHGPFILSPHEKIREYLIHRTERHHYIKEALKRGATSVMGIVRQVYVDVPSEYHFMASRSVIAHLQLLVEEGELNPEEFDALVKNQIVMKSR